MKDVIFQGSRNRPPSGMAEVVMHLVRDELDVPEPDIDDISTLEKIDDQLAVAPAETITETTEATEPRKPRRLRTNGIKYAEIWRLNLRRGRP